ncbi:MAG: ATP-binding protein [Actinomycetota bacterium]|nr:ATP-binding protein [Actinomycetota bacterium]
MEDLLQAVRYLAAAVYSAVALAAFRSWRRERGMSGAWVAAAFATLAFIVLQNLVIPDEATGLLAALISKLTVLGVVFFPYALYRFTTSLKPASPAVDRVASGVALAVALWTLFSEGFPDEDEGRTTLMTLYLVAVVLEFGGLLVTVAVRLWRAGRGQPTLARRRMRLLSVASIGITLALVVAAAQPDDTDVTSDLIVQLMALIAVTLFFIGFTPPALLRMAWRRPEQEALATATEQLVSATTPEEVTANLLPHVTSILGARGAVLLDRDGAVVGAVGETDGGPVLAEPEALRPDVLRLDFDFGTVVIWASPYTPFFGYEEVELLRSLGVLTGLALDRSSLYASEREARAAAERASRELQEANAGLEESRARLAEAQSIAHIGSFTWDTRTDIVSWSDEMYEIYGLPRGSRITYTSYFDYVHEDDREFVQSVVESAVQERRPYSFDHRILRPDGTQRIIHARGRVDVDATGEVIGVVGTAQDVTAAREAERRIATALASEREARRSLEELNEDMESFVYTVSHDLNSPIIAIQGFSEFLSRDFGEALGEKGRFYIERIQVSSSYLQSLIKDLLAFSRIGRVQTEPEDVALEEVVDQVADEVRAAVPQLKVHLHPLPVVRLNPLRARQLFTNLIQNSCRYAGRSDVEVTVAAERVRGDKVSISVRDNGPGVPEEHRKKVFGVFERLQESGPSEGTGIGLPICKRIVETAGGTMWIADSEEGLDIRFTLPLASPAVGADVGVAS